MPNESIGVDELVLDAKIIARALELLGGEEQ